MSSLLTGSPKKKTVQSTMGSNGMEGNAVSMYSAKDGLNPDAVHSASVNIDASHLNHCIFIHKVPIHVSIRMGTEEITLSKFLSSGSQKSSLDGLC